MAINTQKLTAEEFCSIQGLEKISRTAICRMHKNAEPKSYDEWYNLLEESFVLSDKKDYVAPASAPATDANKASDENALQGKETIKK